MVQDAERVAEILRAIGQRNRIHGGKMEMDVGPLAETGLRDIQRFRRGVDTVKLPHPFGDAFRPSAGPAAEVEALSTRCQLAEGEDAEIAIEQLGVFGTPERGLIERPPFLAEAANRCLVEVGHSLSGSWRKCRRLAPARRAVRMKPTRRLSGSQTSLQLQKRCVGNQNPC